MVVYLLMGLIWKKPGNRFLRSHTNSSAARWAKLYLLFAAGADASSGKKRGLIRSASIKIQGNGGLQSDIALFHYPASMQAITRLIMLACIPAETFRLLRMMPDGAFLHGAERAKMVAFNGMHQLIPNSCPRS